MPFGQGHFSELGGNAAELYFLGADEVTLVTQTAKPDQLRRKHLFSHAQENHIDDEPRVKIFNHLMNRANSSTRATGETRLYHLQTDLFRNFIFEKGIQFIEKDVFHRQILISEVGTAALTALKSARPPRLSEQARGGEQA